MAATATATVTVVHKWAKVPNQGQPGVTVIDTTSASDDWRRDLSPFFLGPCDLYKGLVSQNMENAWQFAKVYKDQIDHDGTPSDDYWDWATKGWADGFAHRYPRGKGAVPEFSWWDGKRLSYIDARKEIYGPLYAEAVRRTEGWKELQKIRQNCKELYLRDWDGWNMQKHGMESLTDVLNNPRRKMGHAFVLKMLLEDDPALLQMSLR